MTYLSKKLVPIGTIPDKVSTTLNEALVRDSPSFIKRNLCLKVMLASFVAEHRSMSCSFFIICIHEAGRKPLETKFGCVLVANKQLVAYIKFLVTPIDSPIQ